ncbi:MAG: NUDIX domain-containing protein [Oscillospiraceae bacterium]|nr:NUDIX domain-containing protein [Oscillospiraceae bacterium]
MLGIKSRFIPEQRRGQRASNGKLLGFDIGYLADSKLPEQRRHRTFLLGRNQEGFSRVRVIAMLEKPREECIYIASPVSRPMYEPEIMAHLNEYMDTSGWLLTCHFEKSCGVVVFRRHSGNVEYLLIKNKKGNNWGFPKGHVELGETERETAVREVFEETGLRVEPLEGFRVVGEYHPQGKITKQVIFFLAEMPELGEITLQESEIDRFIWADYGLAHKTFRFNNDRNVLSKAKAWLMGRR